MKAESIFVLFKPGLNVTCCAESSGWMLKSSRKFKVEKVVSSRVKLQRRR